MSLTSSLLVLVALMPGQQPAPDFSHDFRSGESLPASLKWFGGEPGDVIQPEKEGLRITPPRDGKQTWGWGVVATFALSGDFEVTGTYELLKLNRPTRGGPVGVALNLQLDAERNKWAKLGRFCGKQDGDLYVAEYWVVKGAPRSLPKATEARAGKLRLLREGSLLRFLVADAPGDNFQEFFQGEFGTEDMQFRFIVNNNHSPSEVDVRLIDLKVRSATQATPPPPDRSRGGLAAAGLIALLLILASIGLGVWFYVRSRRAGAMAAAAPVAEEEARGKEASPSIACQCPGCGKTFKVKAERAGKAVKCPQCAAVVPVAGTRHG